MRIASLLPSATEMCYALGLGPHLVAVTHECDYPPAARRKPAVTSNVVDLHGRDSGEIHQLISGQLHSGSSIYHLDVAKLQDLQPDLILTQELCPVCAVSYTEVQQACRVLPGSTRVISLEPKTLNDILDNILNVGKAAGREERAREVIKGLRARIQRVAQACAKVKAEPRVFCWEWLDPPFVGGHWVPDMVRIAGGTDGLGPLGQDSHTIPWERVMAYQPEVIVVMPCGFNLTSTLRHFRRVVLPEGWYELPAVKGGQVYAVNGSAYFNRPGPRIVGGLEILAHILHPELVPLPAKLKKGVRRVPWLSKRSA
jgi:iron complex transport system substrate-binding protein